MASNGFRFPRIELGEAAERLRLQARAFLERERDSGGFTPMADGWGSGYSPEFSRKLGQQGWLGMTWPKKYGGGECSPLDRYVVTEELLAAGAPVAAHWI